MKRILSVVFVFIMILPMFAVPSSAQTINPPVEQQLQNGINTFNPDTHTGTFTTHPDYLLDYVDNKGDPIFVPYKITDDNNAITYSSNYDSAVFYRDSCTIKIYSGGKILADSKPIFNSISFDLQSAQNGTDTWSSSDINNQPCNITYSKNENGITLDMQQGISVIKDVRFIFNLYKTPEIFLIVKNNDASNLTTKYGFTIVLNDVDKVIAQNQIFQQSSINETTLYPTNSTSDLIKINDVLKFDTQNKINKYLWATKISNDNQTMKLILDYKKSSGPLLPGQSLTIDPTFTSGNGVSSSQDSTNTDPNFCNTWGNSDGASRITTPASGSTGGSNYCVYNILRYSLTGLNKQWTVTNVNYQYSIVFGSGNDKTCTYTEELNDPNVASGATLFNDVISNPTYLTGDGFCTGGSGTGPFSVSLGSLAITDMNSAITSGKTWFAMGERFNDMAKSHAHLDEVDFSSNKLIITYSWIPPSPVTDLKCNDDAINSISCNWSVPTSTDPILGYYLSKNNTLQAPLFETHLMRDYRFDYNDPTFGIIDYSNLQNTTFTSGAFNPVRSVLGMGNNFTAGSYLTTSGSNLPVGNSDRTVSFWMKTPNALSTSGSIFGWGSGASTNNFSVILNYTNLVIEGGNNDRSSLTTLTPHTLYHIVVVLRNSGTVRDLYINGTEDGNFPYTSSALNTISSPMLIGNGY